MLLAEDGEFLAALGLVLQLVAHCSKSGREEHGVSIGFAKSDIKKASETMKAHPACGEARQKLAHAMLEWCFENNAQKVANVLEKAFWRKGRGKIASHAKLTTLRSALSKHWNRRKTPRWASHTKENELKMQNRQCVRDQQHQHRVATLRMVVHLPSPAHGPSATSVLETIHSSFEDHLAAKLERVLEGSAGAPGPQPARPARPQTKLRHKARRHRGKTVKPAHTSTDH